MTWSGWRTVTAAAAAVPAEPVRPRSGGPAPVGAGWPGDAASATTPIARDAAAVGRLAGSAPTMERLDGRVQVCRACPRLVAWREEVAEVRRASYADERYWGRPIAGYGAERPEVVVVGLAPAAHGGNRTGRVFTGDRSGDFLFASLHRVGLASQPTSEHAGDGLQLPRARVLAAVRCAPPANKPTAEETATCNPWMVAELAFVRRDARAYVALGGFAWKALFPALQAAGVPGVPERPPAFQHGAEVLLGDGTHPDAPVIMGCYHPSQQNTFTGRLTEAMLDDVLGRAAAR